MPKVTLIQVIYNGMKYIPKSFDSMMSQTYENKDFVALICGNSDGGKEYIEKYYPQVKVLDLKENAFFARPHNIIFENYTSDYFQLVNQDLVLEPTYVEEMVKAMEAHPGVGAATGKLLKYDFVNNKKLDTIDTTGVDVWQNGRAQDRGQNQADVHQYDSATNVIAVSGAGPMYRKLALEEIKMPKLSGKSWRVENQKLIELKLTDSQLANSLDLQLTTEYEYFDEDFVAYWEDVDLALRMQSAGWKCLYVPSALGYHGRTAGSTEKDYADVEAYKKHHEKLSPFVRQMNYKNHIFLAVKNFPTFSWRFFAREFLMFCYLVLLERSTLRILPIFVRLLPAMLKKRKLIKQSRKTLEWMVLVKKRGVISVIDEASGIDQSQNPFKTWAREFVKLIKILFQ